MDRLYEEREHLENLLNTRFNFFLVVFAAIIASFFTIEDLDQLILILSFGALIESALAIVIARAQLKLNFYLEEIRKNKMHAEHDANIYANSNRNCLINGSRNRIIGYYIPAFISSTLIISLFFSGFIYRKIIIADQDQKIEEKYIQKIDSIKTCITSINHKLDSFQKNIFIIEPNLHKDDTLGGKSGD